jgi:hypothetical protein
VTKFFGGVLLGVVLGAFLVALGSPLLASSDGYMLGWTVINADGDEVCSDPFIWTATKEIECD